MARVNFADIQDQLPPVEEAAPEAPTASPYQPTDPGDMGVMDYGWDMLKGAAGGVRDAVQETVDFGHGLINGVDDLFGADLVDDKTPDWLTLPDWETKSTAGQITRGVAQFVTGFVGAGKFMKLAKMGGMIAKTGAAAKFVQPAVQGAIADTVAFDPHEERLSNLIEQYPTLGNPLTAYLAADPDDSAAEGRFKQALEGILLGGITDAAFASFRGFKRYLAAKGGDKERLLEAVTQSVDEAEAATKQLNQAPAEGPAFRTMDEAGAELTVGSRVRQPVTGKWGEVTDIDAEKGVVKVAFDEGKVAEMEVKALGGDEFKHVNKDAVRLPGSEVTDDEVADLIAAQPDPTTIDPKAFVNAKYVQWESAADIAKFTDDMTTKLRERGVAPEKYDTEKFMGDVARITDEYGGDANRIFADLAAMPEQLHQAAQRYSVLHGVVEGLYGKVRDLAQKIEIGSASTIEHAEFIHNAQLLKAGVALRDTSSSAWGSGFYHLRHQTSAVKVMTLENVDELINKAGDRKGIMKLAKQINAAADSPKNALQVLGGSRWERGWDVANEWFINAVLSGPKTHIVNTLSNTIKALITPAEQYIGGILEGGTGGAIARREAKELYVGMASYIGDSVRLAWQAVKQDAPILDAINPTMDIGYTPAISSANRRLGQGLAAGMSKKEIATFMKAGPQDGLDHMLDAVGFLVRMPTRFMMGMDEMAKQLAYRSHLRSKLMTKAMEREYGPDETIAFIAEQMERAIGEKGNALAADSLQYARQMTWTQSLNDGLGRSLQSAAARNPWLRQIAPFIRTPTNLLLDAWDHTPIIGKRMSRMKADLDFAKHGDPSRVALARGKMAVGKLFFLGTAMAVFNGALTGAGPRDPKLRSRMYETGWQPYSIRVGDTYIPYQRLEPFGTILGLAADFHDAVANGMDEGVGEFASAMLATVASNITSKTYLKGLMDTANVLQDPDRYAERWVQQQVAARLPFSSALGQTRQMTDPAIREVRSILDAMKNKVPGLSDNLPARRSWVTGEPLYYNGGGSLSVLNPFASSGDKNDPVMDELARLRHGWSGAGKTIEKVELSAKQQSRYSELMGKVELGGKTLYERLHETVQSDDYKSLSDSDDVHEGGKLKRVDRIIEGYKRAAKNYLLRRDPDLMDKVLESRRAKIQLLRQRLNVQ